MCDGATVTISAVKIYGGTIKNVICDGAMARRSHIATFNETLAWAEGDFMTLRCCDGAKITHRKHPHQQDT